MTDEQIKLARKFLKIKIIKDNLTFHGHEKQWHHIYDLLHSALASGESNSALLIGPRGSGKTTLINNVLWKLNEIPNFTKNSIIVKLSGLLHSDDKLALKAITTQMALDAEVGDKVFGSFAENLAYLLSCLKAGKNKDCKSVLFILDEFDLFCHDNCNQTLLYNLFDIAQSQQAPICVIGMTCRLDVIELLEKRVKSRFSHRQIFIFPNDVLCEHPNEDLRNVLFTHRMKLFLNLLSLPNIIKSQQNIIDGNNTPSKRKKSEINSIEDKISSLNIQSPSKKNTKNKNSCEKNDEFNIPYEILKSCHTKWKEFEQFDPIFISLWNESIQMLHNDTTVRNCLQNMFDMSVNEQTFKNFLTQLVCKLSNDHPQITQGDILEVTQNYCNVDDRILFLVSLSVLEISLLITMKHQTEILDGQPMNFEMIFNRYIKFANSNSSIQHAPRAVILKAFEHLKKLELIGPIKESGLSIGHIQKEFQLYRLLVTIPQINEAVKQYKALPTEIVQWATTSLI